jgi:hypothetical protein
MELRIQIVSVLAAVGLLVVVFELVRRRRLLERYALLWLLSAVVLLALAVWQGLLNTLARAIGIYSPPNALFLVAFGFVLLLLLHFSLVISKLTDESKVLAQHVASLDQQVRELRRAAHRDEPAPALPPALSVTPAEMPEPVGARARSRAESA